MGYYLNVLKGMQLQEHQNNGRALKGLLLINTTRERINPSGGALPQPRIKRRQVTWLKGECCKPKKCKDRSPARAPIEGAHIKVLHGDAALARGA
ncbi:MAG: hypothetical protein EA349_13995 [Halomonadaceae bacterium]|nr:MAG: hypothetical protein EA349_13995 [Halomonadaceae bacterium]